MIDADGRIVASLGLFRREFLVTEILPAKGMTLYAKTGEIFGISCTINFSFTRYFSHCEDRMASGFLEDKTAALEVRFQALRGYL